MRKLILFSLLFVKACSLILGQKIVNETYPLPKSGKVSLNLKFADSIRVTAWDRDEIQIKVLITINSGKLNDAFTMLVDKDGGELSIVTDFDKDKIKEGRSEDCKEYVRYINRHGENYAIHSGKGTYWDNGNVVCSDIYFEIKAPNKIDLRLESIAGNIEIQGFAGKLFAKTISGFVDLAWAASRGADLEMKTIAGEVFSNFDVALENQKKNSPVGYLLKGKINGGGVPVHLESISGNIYLRKAN
jgi:DUF4097 and DUF4098 domain-containing protein YvlB